MKKLTDKQAKFARLVVELSNKSEAYRQSYNSNSNSMVQAVAAQKLVKQPEIAARIEEHRQMAQEKHNITVESLLNELEEARTVALTCETPQSSAAVTATMGKAKLCGLDKQIIETTIKVQDDGDNPW